MIDWTRAKITTPTPAPLDVQRLQADLEMIERQGVSISNMDPAIRTIARALRFLVQAAAEG